MDNSQLFPFERNRYYIGKMLTSADFVAEQTYFNNKRRFVNSMMFGSGIICGLSVYSLDDLSIMIDSGVALDGSGREIILETSIVKRLSTIDGFENLKTNRASLCLKYKEEAVHPVYSVNKQEKQEEYEYNRISEGYDLFLLDTSELDNAFALENEFFVKGQLYEDKNYSISLILPASVPMGKKVKLILSAEKLSDEKSDLELKAVLQMPAFFTAKGKHELELRTDELRLNKGQEIRKEYWITAQEAETPDTSIFLKNNSVTIIKGGAEEEHVLNLSLKEVIADISPRDLVTREIGKKNLEMRRIEMNTDFIRLADFNLVRTESAYIIDSVSERFAKKYIPTLSEDMLRAEYLEYFQPDDEIQVEAVSETGENSLDAGQLKKYTKPRFATGVLEIPLGVNLKKGDIRYSGEIMHGLGKGNVYVKVGFEYLADDITLGESAKNTIYGSPELFEEDNPPVSLVETAVKVMNDKGSFVVAARLLKETEYVMLTLRWVAIRFEADQNSDMSESFNGKSIIAETPTVVMATKEKHFFHVKFKNMEPCSLTYELSETGSGEITSEGVYTAPAKEGVYEIRISCTDMPVISTYAYAVVKKKG